MNNAKNNKIDDKRKNNKVSKYITMAISGEIFDFDQIIKLGNPYAVGGITLAHLCCHKNPFSMEQLQILKNPADSDRDTVAHYMAMAGIKFSREDIAILGNPKNLTGKTIADIMDIKDSSSGTFKKSGKKSIRYTDDKHNFFVAKFLERYRGWDFGAYWCTLFINGVLSAYMQDNGSGDFPSEMKILNPEVFKLYTKENLRRYKELNEYNFELDIIYEPMQSTGCYDQTRFFLEELIDEKWDITPLQD